MPNAKYRVVSLFTEVGGMDLGFWVCPDILIQAEGTSGTVDVVVGGFRCQDFIHTGKRGLASVRGTLYQAFVEMVCRVRPKVFVVEIVEGVLMMPGNPVEMIKADMKAAGYSVHHNLLRAEDYGNPQSRHRVFIFGLRNDLPIPKDWENPPVVHTGRLTMYPTRLASKEDVPPLLGYIVAKKVLSALVCILTPPPPWGATSSPPSCAPPFARTVSRGAP